jgi:hypothetical protein
VLAAESVVAAVVLAASPDHRSPVRPSSSESASAVTGVGRDMRSISLGGARTDALLVRVRADLSDAVAAVERFWGTDWPREIVVVAADTDAQFIAQAHLDPQQRWADIAAVSVADDVDVARRQVSGQRIVLAPGASVMSESALRIVLTHELFHFASRADTALEAPR